MPLRPRAARVLVDDAVAEQQLGQSLPSAHQIPTHVLPRADEITERLLLDARDPDRVQPVDHQQPQHPLGVPQVGLDLVLRRALDLPRRRHHAPDPAACSARASPYPVGPASYAARDGPGSRARNSTTFAVSPDSRCERSSPDSRIQRDRQHAARVHVQTSPTANLRHGSALLPYGVLWSTAEAVTLGASHPPHDTRARSAGLPSTPGRPVPPYGPGVEMGVARRGRRFALGSKAGPGSDPHIVWTPGGVLS